jgi:hypothetical protein
MSRTTWHDYAEWATKAVAAFTASGAGVAIVERIHLGYFGQALFWSVYATLAYWLVIREIYFKRPVPVATATASVRVRLALDNKTFGSRTERQRIHRFADKLDAVLAASTVGAYDGDEFGEGECILFMYGPDPELIYRTIEPVLRSSPLLQGAQVELFAPGAETATRTETL